LETQHNLVAASSTLDHDGSYKAQVVDRGHAQSCLLTFLSVCSIRNVHRTARGMTTHGRTTAHGPMLASLLLDCGPPAAPLT
jgi:hypothetical protein